MIQPVAFISNTTHIPALVLFLVIILQFIAPFCCAQTATKDSLLLILASTEEDTTRIDILNELSWIMRRLNHDSGTNFAKAGLELAQKHGFRKREATAFNRLGEIARLSGELDISVQHFNNALKTERSINHLFGIARAQSMLCSVYSMQDHFQKALSAGRESLEIFKQLNLTASTSRTYNRLATIFLKMGQYDSLILTLERKLIIDQDQGNIQGQADSYWLLGLAYYEIGDYEKAKNYYLNSSKVWKDLGNDRKIARLSSSLGNAYWKLDLIPEAIKENERGIELYEKLGLPLLAADNNINLGNLAHLQGDIYTAKRLFQKAIEQKTASGTIENLDLGWYNLGVIYRKLGNLDSALWLFSQVEKQSRKEPILMETYWNCSEIYFTKGKFEQSNLYRKRYGELRDKQDFILGETLKIKEKLEQVQQEQALIEKDNQIKASELQKRNQQLFFLTIAIILLIVLFFFAFQFYRTRKNAVIYGQKVDDLIKAQEIKKLGAELEGRDEERKRIAKELHDRLGGMLSMVKLHFKTVEDQIEVLKDQNKVQYEKANLLLDEACEEVRKISHDMISGVLYKFGLVQALENLAESINQTGQLKVQFIPSGVKTSFGEEREMHLYRIVQELLTNVLKHAKASEVTIQLIETDLNLRLQVDDNGIGFNVLDIPSGIGLKNVEARVDSLQGEIAIDSNPSGTLATVDIPLKEFKL